MQDLPFTSSRDACAWPVLRRLLEVCGASWSQLVVPPPPPSPPAYRQSPLTAYFCKNVSQICLQKSGLICHKKIHLRHPGSCIFYKKSKEGWSSPLSPAYMIHRSQAAAASHCLANISPLLLQMFPDVRTDREFHRNVFRGKRYIEV